MERRPEDIFRLHDLSVLKSPMPTHILNARAAHTTPSPVGSRAGSFTTTTTTTTTTTSTNPSFSTPVIPVRPTPKQNTFALGLSSLARTSRTVRPDTESPSERVGENPNLGAKTTTNTTDQLVAEASPLETLPSDAVRVDSTPIVIQNHNSSGSSSTLPTVTSVLDQGVLPVASEESKVLPITVATESLLKDEPPTVSKEAAKLEASRLKMISDQNPGKKGATSGRTVSTGSEIFLSNWSLVVVPNNPSVTKLDKTVTEDWVVLVGKRNDMSEMWHSSLITGRLSSREVSTGSGRIYRLEGPADELALIEAGFSFDTVEAFKAGFPESWQLVLIQEFGSSLSSSTTAAATTPIPTTRLPIKGTLKQQVLTESKSKSKTDLKIDAKDGHGEPSVKTESVLADSLISEQPVKRKRGRPRKARPELDSTIGPTTTIEDKENSLSEHANQSETRESLVDVATPPQPLKNKIKDKIKKPTNTPTSPMKKIKIQTPQTHSKELRVSNPTPILKRRRSAPQSWWKSPLESTPLTTPHVDVLGLTRSGRRVVAPLPYWENKYLHSSIVTPTPQRLKQVDKRHD